MGEQLGLSMPAVPSTPVVMIVLEGDRVMVNGELVEHDGTRNLHQVAVHAAAQRVAQVLDRPVRAIATDAAGRSALVVHPDGRATDIEVLERFDVVAPAAAAKAEPGVEETHRLAPVIPLATPAASAAPVGELGEARPEDEPAPLAGGSSRSRAGRRSGLVLAASAALLAVLVAVVVLAWPNGGEAKPHRSVTTHGPAATVAPTRETSPTPSAPAPVPTLSATAQVRGTSLRVVVQLAPADPGQAAVLTATGPGGGHRSVSKALGVDPTVLVARNLPPGKTHWTVAVPGAAPVSGDAVVTAPSSPASHAVAPSTSTHTTHTTHTAPPPVHHTTPHKSKPQPKVHASVPSTPLERTAPGESTGGIS